MDDQNVNEAAVNSAPWWDDYFKKKWDSYGGSDQTRYFMQTLIANLPQPEKTYLSAGSLAILDWGCAFGEGVRALGEAFPQSRVTGLDFARAAIAEARLRNPGYEYIWSEDGAIPRSFDAIFTSNCLEHFDAPLEVLEKHLAACKSLYIVLVPYNEAPPLHPQHRVQFQVQSFPVRVGDFTRIHVEPLVVDRFFWPGTQFLVIYASSQYLRDAGERPDTVAQVIGKLEAARSSEWRQADEQRRRAEAAEIERDTRRREAEAAGVERDAVRLEGRNQHQRAVAAELERDKLAQALAVAESLRDRARKGVQDFQARFDQQLAAHRAERAWRIMLAIRKAYTLLVRRLRGGIPSFCGWVVTSALGGNPELEAYEPELPAIANFVPPELFAPPAARKRDPLAPRVDRLYDVVVLPIFDYEFRFQRPQQIAVQLARSGHRVFWISPSRYLPANSQEPYQTIQIGENVWEVRLRVAPFDLYRGALEPSQTAALLEGLDRLYRDLDLNASCVVLQFPFWRQIGLGLRDRFGAKVVYDCMDDWQNWPTEPLPGVFSLAEENKLVGESDVLVVTSRELRDRHAAAQIDSILIPNAADFETFRNPPPNSLLADLRRPIVGYYGAIADWFDLELMTQVARSRPQYSFVLIGQVHLADISELKALPNTHLLGEKPYRELPGYLRQFDVCTLPFRMNRLTQAVDPVKVYEYLSQGKPVVSVQLPELAPLSDLLYFAGGPEEFAAQIDRALAGNDAAITQKRIAFASENTWRDRVAILDGAIRERFPLVSLLVVTYNTREFLRPFLESLRRFTSYPSYEVVVVDNHSSDGSAEELNRYAKADPRIRVFLPEENLGFAGGNNLAARMAKGEYLALLNPDTVLTSGWLEKLLRPLLADPAVGMAAPVSNFSGNETKVNTHYRSMEEMEEFAARRAQDHRGETLEIEVVPLFAGVMRRKVWDEIGGLDDGFKIGTFEDDDFSLRIRKAGYRIVTAEDCFIHHFGNGSFGKLESETMLRIFDQNKKRFESKWNIAWRPHKTRPGVRPISADSRIGVAEFCQEEEGAGGP